MLLQSIGKINLATGAVTPLLVCPYGPSVYHERPLGCNSEVRCLSELVHLDALSVYSRCACRGMHGVVLTRHLCFILKTPMLYMGEVGI